MARPAQDLLLVRLVVRLMGGERLTTSDICAECGVGSRAAARWRKRLREALPGVRQVRVGHEAALILDVSASEAEHVARSVGLEMALRAVAPLAGSPWHDALRALAEASEARVRHLPHQVAALRRGFAVVERAAPTDAMEPTLRAISEAWQARRWVHLRYRSLAGRTNARRVQIWGVALRAGEVFVLAAHRGPRRMILRQYRIDSLVEVELEEARFRRPVRFDATATFHARWGGWITEGDATRVVVEVRGDVASLVQRTTLESSQELLEAGDGWQRVAWTVHLCPELESWLLGLVPDVRIVEPPALRERLRSRVAAWIEQGDHSDS